MENNTITPSNYTEGSVITTTSFAQRDCELFSGETWKCYVLIITKRLSCLLSITGSLFTLVLIVLFKKFRESSHRMIVHLSVVTVMSAVAMCIEDITYQSTTLCQVQGVLLTYFGWSCCLWIITVMCNMHFKLVYLIDLNKYEKLITVFNWVCPSLVIGLPFLYDMYGPAGAWCWIRNDWKWRLGLWYFLRIVTFTVIIVTTSHLTVTLNKIPINRVSFATSVENIDDDIKTLRLYPILFFVLNLFPVIDRVHNAIVNRKDQSGYIFPVLLVHSFCEPLSATVITLVYALDRNTRQKLNRVDFYEAFQSWRRKSSDVREYSLSNTSSERRFL